MFRQGTNSRLMFVSILTAASFGFAASQTALARSFVADSTPRFTQAAGSKNLGPANPSQVIDISLWLNVHNRAGLDSLYKEQYEKTSVNYHAWLKHPDFVRQYAPTAAEAAQVSAYLTAHGLRSVSVGPDNMFVHAQGTVAAVSQAFQVSINRYQFKGNVYRANASDPQLDSSIAGLVHNISGLTDAGMSHPMMTTAIKPGKASGSGSFSAADAGAGLFQSSCFTSTTAETVGVSGQYPYGVAKGNKYNSGISGCGYTPSEIQTAYNLKSLYKEGYDGSGQTIVIIDWCGSPTILADANAFSAKFGLPPLSSSNFSVKEYPRPSTCAQPDTEINLDVEWAHAIAPGARILLLVPPSPSFADTDEAEYYAIVNDLGSVISASYGAEEYYVPPAEVVNESLLNEIAAVFGVAANFSSGDSGDFTYDFPQFSVASVSMPADSPYVTAVGGVSLALNSNNTIKWQTGWGTNIDYLDGSGQAFDPPSAFFYGGSGGGPSAVFGKPSYQSKLAGTHRQVPDISWLADPFTGGVIVISYPFQVPEQIYTVIGGTSLACPMFSALWAIANQEAGVQLGQAAPYLYSMPKGTIMDVLAVTSSSNVSEVIHEAANASTNYSAQALAAPLENTHSFYSALFDYPLAQDTTLVLTFGTDSGLTTGTGWDNVTGLGVPNGKAFADYFNPAK